MSALTDLIRRKQPGEAWETAAGTEAANITQSQEITVDAATSDGVFATFDLGVPALVYITATLLSADPDGETYGGGVGEIVFDIEKVVGAQTLDGLTTAVQGLFAVHDSPSQWDQDNPYQYLGFAPPLPAQTHAMMGAVGRYARAKAVIWEDFEGQSNYYSGGNNPTATWRIDAAYVG